MESSRNTRRSRGFCFTCNNYNKGDRDMFMTALQTMKAKYIIIGKEVGEVNKTKHLQGYVYFENARSWNEVHKVLPRCNLRAANGSAESNKIYCSKEGKFIEYGTLPRQGKRSDLEAVASAVLSGEYNEREIAEEFPVQYIKFNKGIKALIQKNTDHRTERPIVVWLWGKAGVGKSHYAIKKHGRDNVFIKDETRWWDTYENEIAVLIDDFDPEEINFRKFLRLMDENKYVGENKGGTVIMNSKYIYISCEYPPEHFWADNKLDQVETRISEIIEIRGECKRQRAKRTVYDNTRDSI